MSTQVHLSSEEWQDRREEVAADLTRSKAPDTVALANYLTWIGEKEREAMERERKKS